jgi:hypothetical protein
MEEQNILKLWRAQDSKIDQVLQMNAKILKEQISQKSQKALFGLKAEKITGLVFGAIYLFILGSILGWTLKHQAFENNIFLVSISIIFLVNIKVYADYVKHLVLANQIDFAGSVLDIQQKLVDLKFSLIRNMRYWVIQLPFYTLFQLGFIDFSTEVPVGWLIIQIAVSILLAIVAIWIFIRLKPENAADKKVKWLIALAGGKQIEKATEQLQEIKEFQ